MTEPPRLLDARDSFTARLLRAAELDRPPVGALSNALRRAGIDGSAAIAPSASTAPGIAQIGVLKAVMFCAVVSGSVVGTGDSVNRAPERPRHAERAAIHERTPIAPRVPREIWVEQPIHKPDRNTPDAPPEVAAPRPPPGRARASATRVSRATPASEL